MSCLSGWPSGWLAGELSPDCLLAVCRVSPPVCFRDTDGERERERERERETEIRRERERVRERGRGARVGKPEVF